MRPTSRHLTQAAGLLLLAAAIGYTVSLVMVLVVSQQDQRVPVDAIVVPGHGPSTTLGEEAKANPFVRAAG